MSVGVADRRIRNLRSSCRFLGHLPTRRSISRTRVEIVAEIRRVAGRRGSSAAASMRFTRSRCCRFVENRGATIVRVALAEQLMNTAAGVAACGSGCVAFSRRPRHGSNVVSSSDGSRVSWPMWRRRHLIGGDALSAAGDALLQRLDAGEPVDSMSGAAPASRQACAQASTIVM